MAGGAGMGILGGLTWPGAGMGMLAGTIWPVGGDGSEVLCTEGGGG